MTSPTLPHDLTITINGLAVLRLMQIDAYHADLSITPLTEQALKKAALSTFITDTAQLAVQNPGQPQLAALSELHDADAPTAGQRELITRELAQQLPDTEIVGIISELAIATQWPDKVRWSASRSTVLAHAARALAPTHVSAEDIDAFVTLHKRARRRLGKDAASPGSQIALGAVMAAATVAAPGVGHAAGTFVGTHFLGYSGAAATSAGLALLGGGSIASGGLGMAGGIFLIDHAVHAGTKGAYRLATSLATEAPAAFIEELARLDVAVSVGALDHDVAVSALHEANDALLGELETLRPRSVRSRRRANLTELARSIAIVDTKQIVRLGRQIKQDLPVVAERRLARCQRALDFELRHLEAPTWKRHMFTVSRFVGVPAANRLLDRV